MKEGKIERSQRENGKMKREREEERISGRDEKEILMSSSMDGWMIFFPFKDNVRMWMCG